MSWACLYAPNLANTLVLWFSTASTATTNKRAIAFVGEAVRHCVEHLHLPQG